MPLIALSPYFYKSQCRLFFTTDNDQQNNYLAEQLSSKQYKEIVVLSKPDFYDRYCSNLAQNTETSTTFFSIDKKFWEVNELINNWICDRCAITYKSPIIINGAIPDDGYFIGQLAGLSNSPVLLIDPNNLDNVLDSYQLIRNNNVDSLTFVGGSLFSPTDKKILLKAIAIRESEN